MVKLAKEQHYLTFEDINDALPDDATDADILEEVIDRLRAMEFKIIDASDVDTIKSAVDKKEEEEENTAAAEAERDLGITLKGIITCIRHFGPDAAKPAATCAVETFGNFITGFGMAGGELVGRPKDYAYAFDMAREAVIVGVGDVPLDDGKVVGGGSVLQVQARAAKAALDDAGISMRDVDGLLVAIEIGLLDNEEFSPLRANLRHVLRHKTSDEVRQILDKRVVTVDRLPSLLRFLEREHEKMLGNA